MNTETKPDWGSSLRLNAAERFKAKSAAMGRDVTEALVEYAAPRPDMQILDLASGTGEPAITLASRIGSSGHVTALDLSADLLAIAADRARQRGLTNISTRQGDAQQLPFSANQFDLATSRFGVMFFADVDRALREVHRVVKPNARACFVVWGTHDQPYFSASFGTVHRHVGGPLLAADGPDPFRFARQGSLSEALKKSGFDSHRPLDLAGIRRRSLGTGASRRRSIPSFTQARSQRKVARNQRRSPLRHSQIRRPGRHQIHGNHCSGFRPKTLSGI